MKTVTLTEDELACIALALRLRQYEAEQDDKNFPARGYKERAEFCARLTNKLQQEADQIPTVEQLQELSQAQQYEYRRLIDDYCRNTQTFEPTAKVMSDSYNYVKQLPI